MENFAIKGHETRGSEIIKILAMLGGNNAFGHFCNNASYVYYVDKSYKNHIICSGTNENNIIIFTLEEFLEKFPYKVGDKVLINHNNNDIYTVKSMVWNEDFNRVAYKIEAVDGIMDNHTWFAHEMVFFSPKKEEDMEEKIESFEILESHCANEVKIEFDPSKFEMVKRDSGYYVVKKQPKYPITYEECCDVLNIAYPYFDAVDSCIYASTYKNELFGKFKKLLICRDAYWKIAGDWREKEKAKHYVIYSTLFGELVKVPTPNCIANYLLDFPSEEMCDEFFENFKDLIENCKDLL